MSRAFRFAAWLSAAALLAGCANDAPPGTSAPARPLTLDTHIDIPLDYATAATDPLTADLQVNLTKMAAGGLDAGFFIVFVGQTARTAEGYARAPEVFREIFGLNDDAKWAAFQAEFDRFLEKKLYEIPPLD